jgi:putative SOS response-associated peptidase YedK
MNVQVDEKGSLEGITNDVNVELRYNIPPTEPVAVMRSDPAINGRRLDMLRWGVVAYWAKDIKIGFSLINAKAETVAEEPVFRDAFKECRCGPLHQTDAKCRYAG